MLLYNSIIQHIGIESYHMVVVWSHNHMVTESFQVETSLMLHQRTELPLYAINRV